MNKSFQTVLSYYKASPTLTHRQEIMRLYRHSLRLIASWSEDREVFNVEATKVRGEFNANKHHAVDSGATIRLVREAKERLFSRTHPDPYIAPYMPGGSLFMRNSPPPLEVVFPDGIPEGYSTRKINIDMSNLEEGQEYANKFLVDSANKVYQRDN